MNMSPSAPRINSSLIKPNGKPLTLTILHYRRFRLKSVATKGAGIHRIKALYSWLQDAGVRINLLTYGGREDLDYQSDLPGIRILCNWMELPEKTYAHRFHQLHAWRLLQSHLAITNDSSAITEALRLNWAWKIPFIYRVGYIWSPLHLVQHPGDREGYERIYQLEQRALNQAAHISASTEDIGLELSQRVASVGNKLSVIPHYVDTELFRPIPSEAKQYDLIYVGRMVIEKNLHAILEAVEKTGLTIAMAGQGNLTAELKEKFINLEDRICWLGNIDNPRLPIYMNRARAYVLCSFTEGHPRALI